MRTLTGHKSHESAFSSIVVRVRETLQNADVLLIVPPFHHLKYPNMSVQLLQSCGRQTGFRVQVLYANILLASVIGETAYARICDAPMGSFAGERFFARSAFGLPPLGYKASRMNEPDWVIGPNKSWEIRPDFDCLDSGRPITLKELLRLEKHADGFVDGVARAVANRGYSVVGCTSFYGGTISGVALLSRIKTLRKASVTILGGASCEGEMAQGMASLRSGIDYIFSGESEFTFPKFVKAVLAGATPPNRVIRGRPCRNMDALPTPAYAEFYEQRRRFLPLSKLPAERTEIPYETSRGCWWGQETPCRFCGLSGETMVFRQKSPGRVIQDLRVLLKTYPTRNLIMTDNIMPYTYFRTLLPRLATEFPKAVIFYQQRADLSLPQVVALRRAGIKSVQAGIESLSSCLLALMNKGTLARQGLMLLRNARAAGLNLGWGLLWGIPGDNANAYEDILAILPLLHHLQPPCALLHLSIERFSPYFSRPTEFGVRNIRPLGGYYGFLPKGADVERIAYHFLADYRCGSHYRVGVIHRLWKEITRWQGAWKGKGPVPSEDLRLFQKRRSYVLVDTRGIWREKRSYPLDEKEARILLNSGPFAGSEVERWALRKKLGLIVDDWFVPLAVADPKVLLELAGERSNGRSAALRESVT